MLTQIELENFKCFKERTAFPLGQLTLLTGINGCGKSTLLQSLLLMRQSIEHNENTDQILLNGSCVSLNSFNDVRNTNNSRYQSTTFKYYINSDINDPELKLQGNIEYCLNENLDDDMVAKIVEVLFIGRIELNKSDKYPDNILYYDIDAIYQYDYFDSSSLNKSNFDYIMSKDFGATAINLKDQSPFKIFESNPLN